MYLSSLRGWSFSLKSIGFLRFCKMLKYLFSVLFLSCDFSTTIPEIQLTFSHGFKIATKKLGFEIEPETRVMNLSAPPAIWRHCRRWGHSFQELLPRNSVSQQNDVHLGKKLLPTDFTSGISLAFMTSVYSTWVKWELFVWFIWASQEMPKFQIFWSLKILGKMRVLQLDPTIRALMQDETPSGPQVITEEYFFTGK